MRPLVWLAAVILIVSGGLAAAQQGWTRYSYTEARFSVTMPSAPIVALADGAARPTTTYVANGPPVTIVLATDLGQEVVDVAVTFNAVEAGRKAAGDAVLSRRYFTFQGAATMDLVFRTKDGQLIADRIIYRQGWLYQLMAEPGADGVVPGWGKMFHDSFRFTD